METDEELVSRATGGDEHAFSELVERHMKGVYSFALRYVGAISDAEDVTQETFLKVWKNLKKFSSAKAGFKTWVMKIVRNASVDFLRKKKHIPFSAFKDEEGNDPFLNLPDEAPLPDELAMTAEEVGNLQARISELPFSSREVLLLYYGSGLTFEETADALGISVNTVKSRHRRAKIALQKDAPHAPK